MFSGLKHVDPKIAVQELQKLELPEGLSEYTGHVMYPDEISSKWENEGEALFLTN